MELQQFASLPCTSALPFLEDYFKIGKILISLCDILVATCGSEICNLEWQHLMLLF
jgi:hypothetical protein